MILVNMANQIGAGPRNLSLNFIRAASALDNNSNLLCFVTDDAEIISTIEGTNLNFKVIPIMSGSPLRVFRFFYIQIIIFLYSTFFKFEKVVSFGNYFILGRANDKRVLLHHPYILDDALLRKLPASLQLIERIKRIFFRITLLNVNSVIVQSDYMRDLFIEKHKKYASIVQVIPNPLSDVFSCTPVYEPNERLSSFGSSERFSAVFVSRYYPHKNHQFLIEVAQLMRNKGNSFILYVTLDPCIPGVDEFMQECQARSLQIQNLGELGQDKLIQVYRNADAAIFPSKAETFGNPLIEAMRFSLPVIAPNKEYARSILSNAGCYYSENDAKSCYEVFSKLRQDNFFYSKACERSFVRGSSFPNSREWLDQMLGCRP